jgi:transcriptional regulator GlxA family with amidase domain
VVSDKAFMRAVAPLAGGASVSGRSARAFILGALGVLDRRSWTTHWEDVEELPSRVPTNGEAWVR